MASNYFVCTLGQASQREKRDLRHDINSLIDDQAGSVGTKPAAAFAYPGSSGRHRSRVYDFRTIRTGSIYAASTLRPRIANGHRSYQSTVALLCPSTPDFLFAWLGLIRLGYAVLLLAPQCQPEAVAHLCRACNVSILLYDELYEKIARDTESKSPAVGETALSCMPLGFSVNDEGFVTALEKEFTSAEGVKIESTDIAYLHHTSGTSSGLPKPIAQSHRAAVGVLPHFPEGSESATFTTTPLYHGGIADLFRAWTSNALIWLFPGKSSASQGQALQITASDVLSCLEIARSLEQLPPVKYFSSVPYVLQMLASGTEGLNVLNSMDCVGVGGAALPSEVGDSLVAQGVNLLSRFGSAECGFIASSHREYKIDREWQYLRTTGQEDLLQYEPREDKKHELVVLPAWPHRAKTNRADGSFSTSDLFVPHESIPHAWKYDSRADSQLTLVTGKKFDPAPLEATIATSNLLDDVLIFGDGRPFPGALLFRSQEAADMTEEKLLSSIAAHVEKLNSESQSHARIPRNMLVPIVAGRGGLEKSSKGTIIRKSAEATYRDVIDDAYNRLEMSVTDKVPDELVSSTIQDAIVAITGQPIGLQDDLYSHGVDSVGSTQLRYTLQRLLPSDADKLPMTVVEEHASVRRLTDMVLRRRTGSKDDEQEDELQLMNDLVSKYSAFPESNDIAHNQSPKDPKGGTVVVLTGATGGLGAHLLNHYRDSTSVSHVYCLARGANTHAATERVNKSLTSRGLPALHSCSSQSNDTSHDLHTRIEVLPCKLSDPKLGLDSTTYRHLAATATLIIHAAWTVNFRLRLRSFIANHIAGTHHLLFLALASPPSSPTPTLIFCSSTASVSASPSYHVPEAPSKDPHDASPLGYSRSKWVTEQICSLAAQRQARLRGRVAIVRIGQLAGDSARGVWNATEAWPLMLGSVRATGVLPDLKGQKLDWLPVDVAARAVAEVAEAVASRSELANGNTDDTDANPDVTPVYHVVQPNTSSTWTDLLVWLHSLQTQDSKTPDFKNVTPQIWLEHLSELQERQPNHPALKLLEVWRAAYGTPNDTAGTTDKHERAAEEEAGSGMGKEFDTSRARAVAPSLRDVGAVDRDYFMRLWSWIRENVDE